MNTNETEQPIIAETKTKELCGNEHHGLRCMRSKGHRHQHAAYTTDDTVIWE